MAITFNLFWLAIYTLFVAIATAGLYWKTQKFFRKHFGH
jgi:hypothetical protein